ncbi:MAG: hypothetical protein ACLFR2_12045 [Candidatus Kapaibacterium sp.]
MQIKGKQYSTGLDNTAQNRKRAKEMLEEIHIMALQQKNGLPQQSVSITYGQALEKYLITYKQVWQPTTYEGTQCILKLLIKGYEYNDITNESAGELLKRSAGHKNLKASTLKYRQSKFRYFLKYIKEEFLPELQIPGNFLKTIKRSAVVEIMPYTDQEFGDIVSSAVEDDIELALLLLIMEAYGLRIRETISMIFDQIDWEKRILILPWKTDRTKYDVFPIDDCTAPYFRACHEIAKNREKRGEYLFRWSTYNGVYIHLKKIETRLSN